MSWPNRKTIMGYTHYWRHGTLDSKTWANIAADAVTIIRKAGERGLPLMSWNGEDGDPSVNAAEISLNGSGDDSHESFTFKRDGGGFDFCKTAQKPYDVVVTALLCIIGHHAGDAVSITSDGTPSEWADGFALAEAVRPGVALPLTEDDD